MKKLYTILLVAAGCLILNVSCQQEELAPLETPNSTIVDEIDRMKAELDEEILSVIRSTGAPFDWGTASDDMIRRALIVTGFPLVVGYLGGEGNGRVMRNEILEFIYESEGVDARREQLGEPDEILSYKDDKLNFFHVNVQKTETIEGLRRMAGVRYMEPAGYPILMDELEGYYASQRYQPQTGPDVNSRNMVLDPYQESPDYYSQVQSYSGSIATYMRRHNVDHVYRDYEVYGENIGIAVMDNGVLPEYQSFIRDNGYGARTFTGYYNPLWFLPFTEPDGAAPQTPDVLFVSQFVEGQWLHGWQMNEDVLVAAPNAAQYSVRASPLVLLLFPAQNIGVINSIVALADNPDINISSMSMGSLFRVRPMEDAIDYYHSQDKILVTAAGTSFPFIRDLLGVIFPARYDEVVAATGIENREDTGGEFILGENSHGGPEVDFCVERNGSSSGATARLAGMVGLVWSANPELTREEVIEILISSSNFYQELGTKNGDFGWGTPDILQAVEAAISE